MTDPRVIPEAAQAVLDYWFGAPGSVEFGTQRELWFRKRDATDREIAQRFGALIERALRGELEPWGGEAPSALAQIVVLDQFTRNAFRDSARAFAGDPRALRAAQAMVGAGTDCKLPAFQRAFVYLPFEHSESLPIQLEAVRLFTRLADEAPELREMLDYARRHCAVVQQFGRFPHRNTLLQRQSSAEELTFLRQPGSRF